MSAYHVPVLLRESLAALNLSSEGIYVDVTFGGGGHSREILNQLTSGQLLVFDQDEDARGPAEQLQVEYPERSFTFVASNFRYLKKYLRLHGVAGKVSGILADLGVSSHQFNEGSRGFSTRFDGPIDMRMNRQSSLTAADLVNTYPEADLIHILSAYGEVKNARTLARALIQHRPITELAALKAVAEPLAPRGRRNQYLAQVFQALRIQVNEELTALQEMLEQSAEVLAPGGRLVVISYHSLEDRLVKQFINKGVFRGPEQKDLYGRIMRPLDPVNRKVIRPEVKEIEENNRARSARLRIGEKRHESEYI